VAACVLFALGVAGGVGSFPDPVQAAVDTPDDQRWLGGGGWLCSVLFRVLVWEEMVWVSRSSGWRVLGLGGDPVPGDPVVVCEGGERYLRVADAIARTALRN
jgi:hypothetical protein